MTEGVRVKDGEIFVGKALAWSTYDRNGRLLLQRGETIASRRQLEILLRRGLYRHDNDHARDDPSQSEAPVSPFELLGDLRQRIAALTGAIVRAQPESRDRADRLINDLQSLCDRAPDAALGSIHLFKDAHYSVCHPLHSAILCELIGKRISFDDARRKSVIGAALTQNVAMSELQDRLRRQRETVTATQRTAINAHPEGSVDMLRRAGIDDSVWLAAVAQHHERMDGSGYPQQLSGEAIAYEARLLAVTDRYTAMVSEREYRTAFPAKTALRHFFDANQQQFDAQFGVMLIKELGIYPPGSWVRLANGEIGIVLKRTANATQPKVATLVGANGSAYVRPMRRETDSEKFRICDVIPARTLAFNLSTLWGYQ